MARYLHPSPYVYVGLVKQDALLGFLDVHKSMNYNRRSNNTNVTTIKRLPTRVVMDNLFTAIEEHYGVTKEDMKSIKRHRPITYARHVFAYWLKDYYGDSITYGRIGMEINKDHSTMIYAIGTFRMSLLNNEILPKQLKKPGATAQTDYSIINNKIYSLCL